MFLRNKQIMKKKINVVAVVAARKGSKGIPRKNKKKLNGVPLICYGLKTLNNISSIDRIILSTDDDDIIKIVKKLNYKKLEIRFRPKHLSGDLIPLTTVAHYTANQLYKEKYIPHVVLQVAPTCPFIKKKTIEKIIEIMKSKKTNCCVTLKKIEHEHPYRAKIFSKKTKIFKQFLRKVNVEKFISRQDLPLLYCTSGAIYARTFNLLKSFSNKDFCLGSKPFGVLVDDIESINIDRPIDFEFANFVSKKYKII